MSSVFAVIRREYLQRVKNKWFILSTIGLPLLMAVMFVGPILIEANEQDEGNIVVVDRTGRLADDLVGRLEGRFDPQLIDDAPDVIETLQQRVEDGEIFGFLVVDESTLEAGAAQFQGDGRPGTVRRIQLQQAVVQSALAARLSDQDTDVSGLLGGGSIDYVNLSEEAEGAERGTQFVVGFAGSMMLYIVLLLYGVQVGRSVLEEKTSRIVEVVVSAIEPWQLMLGKIVGVGGVALTQMAIWIGAGALLMTMGLPMLIASRPELAELQNLSQYLPALTGVFVYVAYFTTGFLMFSGMYAAVAAMVSSDEEFQQSQTPVVMLLVAPVILLAPVIEDPNGPLAFWLSFVPFFSPVLMFPRYINGAPLWQPLVGLIGMIVAIWAVAWVAGRIYRVGILMQGKRPNLPELLRWVREA